MEISLDDLVSFLGYALFGLLLAFSLTMMECYNQSLENARLDSKVEMLEGQ